MLTQKRWEQIFLSLHKNAKQKEAFDIQYKFLHFAQPFATCLREIGQNYGNIKCVRCNKADETQKPWLFSCSFSQYVFIYLLCLLEHIHITQVIDNTVENSLLYHLLRNEKEAPVSRKLFQTYFTTTRHLRKEATYGRKYAREQELELLRNNIRESLYFIYNVGKIQQMDEGFFRIWGKIITREGIINIPQGVVTT